MNFIPKIEYVELGTGTPKTITFDSPPEGDPLDEQDRVVASSERSTSGVRQTQFNYSVRRYEIEFLFQTEAVKDAVQDFFLNHASKGGEFNYFIHSDEVEFETMELVNESLKYNRPIPDVAGTDFQYNFKFTLERVV